MGFLQGRDNGYDIHHWIPGLIFNEYPMKKYPERWDKGGTVGVKGGIIFLVFNLLNGLKMA